MDNTPSFGKAFLCLVSEWMDTEVNDAIDI